MIHNQGNLFLNFPPPPPPPPPQPPILSPPPGSQYCHYVAGLVGDRPIDQSQLFFASGLEGEGVGRDKRLANSMGLFLQKTNIIRDYLEDTLQGRESGADTGIFKGGGHGK